MLIHNQWGCAQFTSKRLSQELLKIPNLKISLKIILKITVKGQWVNRIYLWRQQPEEVAALATSWLLWYLSDYCLWNKKYALKNLLACERFSSIFKCVYFQTLCIEWCPCQNNFYISLKFRICTIVIMPCSVRNFKITEWLKWILLVDEISQNFTLRWVLYCTEELV